MRGTLCLCCCECCNLQQSVADPMQACRCLCCDQWLAMSPVARHGQLDELLLPLLLSRVQYRQRVACACAFLAQHPFQRHHGLQQQSHCSCCGSCLLQALLRSRCRPKTRLQRLLLLLLHVLLLPCLPPLLLPLQSWMLLLPSLLSSTQLLLTPPCVPQ